ncbi:MAG: potassium/proton antiporter [Bacteroidales bacterium]|nr:potassium/proton antiporter [Bacteroidales bacterium]
MQFTSENIFLISSILVFTAILVSRTGTKYGVPSLLVFLLVGMLFGSDGVGLVFDNYNLVQFLSIVALCVILFTGGMETKIKEIRPVLGPGIVLSTAGVLLTVIVTGLFIFFLSRIEKIGLSLSIVMCFLLAAVMSSTDSASVFSILKNCNMRLKQNLRPMLELESGSNDPMAYVLTIVLIQVAKLLYDPASSVVGIDYKQIILGSLGTLVVQMVIGTLMGLAVGFISVHLLKKIKLSASLYSIMLLAVSLFAFSMTQSIHGNGYLAVYIAGLYIGNHPMNSRKEILSFMDGMTWIMQIGMFLSLGLLVNPKQMMHVAPIALLIGLFMIFIGRPLTVFLCLIPFRKISFRAKLFTSWVGLKGAVPIIFATYPIIEGIPGSEQIFNIVFFITLLSLIFQGMSIPRVAKLLHLNLPMEKIPETFGIEIPEEAGKLQDYTLTDDDLENGNTLKEIQLPEGARVVIIRRDDEFIVPDGQVELQSGDQFLMIYSDNSKKSPKLSAS